MNKNAQMEIMGLVVIVMILVVALLFLIFFASQTEQPSIQKSFDNQQLAYNTVSAMLQASTTCRNLRVQELLQNCAWRNDIVCEGVDGCSFVMDQISTIFERTLHYVHQDYNFYLFSSQDPDVNILSKSKGTCGDDRVSAQYPLKYAGGELFVGLDICDQKFVS